MSGRSSDTDRSLSGVVCTDDEADEDAVLESEGVRVLEFGRRSPAFLNFWNGDRWEECVGCAMISNTEYSGEVCWAYLFASLGYKILELLPGRWVARVSEGHTDMTDRLESISQRIVVVAVLFLSWGKVDVWYTFNAHVNL